MIRWPAIRFPPCLFYQQFALLAVFVNDHDLVAITRFSEQERFHAESGSDRFAQIVAFFGVEAKPIQYFSEAHLRISRQFEFQDIRVRHHLLHQTASLADQRAVSNPKRTAVISQIGMGRALGLSFQEATRFQGFWQVIISPAVGAELRQKIQSH